MGNIPLESGIHDRLHDRRVVDFLLIIEVVSTWITSGMVMPKILVVVSDTSDNISLVDLHMVDVKKEFEILT